MRASGISTADRFMFVCMGLTFGLLVGYLFIARPQKPVEPYAVSKLSCLSGDQVTSFLNDSLTLEQAESAKIVASWSNTVTDTCYRVWYRK